MNSGFGPQADDYFMFQKLNDEGKFIDKLRAENQTLKEQIRRTYKRIKDMICNEYDEAGFMWDGAMEAVLEVIEEECPMVKEKKQ